MLRSNSEPVGAADSWPSARIARRPPRLERNGGLRWRQRRLNGALRADLQRAKVPTVGRAGSAGLRCGSVRTMKDCSLENATLAATGSHCPPGPGPAVIASFEGAPVMVAKGFAALRRGGRPMGTDEQGGTGRIDVTIDEDRPPTRTDPDAVGGARNKDPIEAPISAIPLGPELFVGDRRSRSPFEG